MFTMGPAFFGAESDPYAANVLSLLHFDGANGSTTFTDQVAGHSWGATGGSTISTAQSKFGGSSLNVPISSNIELSSPGSEWVMTGDLSIECWMLTDGTGGLAGIVRLNTSGASLTTGPSSSTAISITINGITRAAGDGAGSIYGRWVHCFFGRSGSTTYVACNGVMTSFPLETGMNMSGTISTVRIGSMPSIAGSPYHYIDDIRITKGVCRYTATFTPPTAPYPNP